MEEKMLLDLMSKMLDERDQRLADMIDKKLEKQGQQITNDLKEYIRSNNVVIGETLTLALEDTQERVAHIDELLAPVQKDAQTRIKKLEKVTQNILYDVALLKQG